MSIEVKPKRKYNYTRKTGAPTKYRKEYCQVAEDLTAQGYSMPVVGLDCGGVLVDTVLDWMKVYPDFNQAIKRGRAKRLKELEFMITCHAKGIKTKSFDPKNSNLTAIIFELKTRFHEQWSDKQKILELISKAGGSVNVNVSSSPIDLCDVIKGIKNNKKKG